ncbi:MAG: tandem-95 repeat protein, partial [Flavobacteriales bacterium]|nr:tandem-95 repeat protein [Flavobacteriales bacterium]
MNLLIKVKGNYYSLLSLMLLFFVSTSVLAEGTRQMSPVNSANGTALVVWPSSTRGTYLNAPVDQRLQFTVDDHTTENLYFGFHTRTYDNFSSAVVTDAYYRIYNQAGTQVAGPTLIPTTGAGYIQDYNEAFAGPNIGGATPAGYTPFLFDPTTNGDFYIEIYRSSDGGTTSNNLEIMMPFFDFTVSDPSNNQVDGRVWCRKWSFATVDLVAVDGGGNNTYNNALGGSSLADFFVYTQDQQILSIDFQTGFNPLAFEITTNFYGISNTGNFTNDRRSTNNFTGVSPTLANGYQIFLNQPDLNIFPISPTSQPAITSNIFGCPGNYFIPYVIAEAGDISIFLDLNGTPGYQAGTADLVLEDYGLAAGNHLMAWNGLDGLGNVAPVNVSTSVVVTIYRGRTNIPLYDAELNTNGLIVTGLFPATNNRPLYWDDRLLTVSGGTCTGGTNNTEVVIPGTSAQAGMLDGVLGPSHAWDGTGSGNVVPAPNSGSDGSATVNLLCDDFGNIRTINTWFWALDASSPVTAMIVPDCDVDGDGIDDITDIDNDNDGILDVDENIDDPFGDNDGDLIYNYLDLDYPGFVDVNSDGINDNFDLDLDGLVNAIDHDSDGDGCLDVFEAGYTDVSPADGEVDGTGYNPDGTVAGSDGYGLPLDQNGNFVFDYLENIDTDGDGFGDNCDDDDDNDGIVDNLDNAPLDPSSCIDDDGDGCDDCSQTASNDFAPGANNDITNDGLDTDGDGICNVGDLDDDNDGCLDVNDTDPLVANPLNIVATATPGAICAGDPVNLSATGGATYTWDNGLGAGASHSVSPTTTTTYTVTGDNGLGCTSTGTVTVTVTPLPTTPVATNNSPICEGETLNLTASTITGATYAWTGPSSFTSTSQNPTVSTSATILMSGTYSVTATVAGCTSLPATTSVTVNTIPAAPTVSSNSPVCAVTGDINLTASTIVGATYAWTGPNSFSSTSQNPSITGATALNAGTYNVTATVAGCISPSATTAVVINNCGPTANDDVATSNLLEDGADGTINILGNDTDIDGTPSAPTNGVGQYVVDLDPSTPGTQTTYTDATGTWTYNPATGVVTFDPANDYNGTATITYELFDPEGNSDQAVITFTVDPVNDVPSQGNETLTGVQEDATTPTTSGDLTANNIDPDGTTTTVTTVVSTTGGGTTTITGGGTTIDYTPAPNFNGVDTVIYTVCDAGTPMPAQCVNDTLFVTVDPVNDAPSQGNETLTVNEDDPATTSVDLTTNNIDPDGTTTTVTTVVSTTGGGTTTITGGGTTIDYTPAPNFNGVDTVIYTVCDAGIPLPAACVNDTLFVTVNPINDAPSQGNETLTGVQEDATTPTTSGDLTVNNIDPDGTTTTVTTVVSTTGGGTTTITNGG